MHAITNVSSSRRSRVGQALRTRNINRMHRVERFADAILILALLLMVAVCCVIKPETAAQFVPSVTDYLGKAGGSDVAKMLGSVMK